MKTYELNQNEINLIVNALRYVKEYADEETDADEYQELCVLIDKLDPKPVQKEGWMVVWDGGGKSCVFATKGTAEEWWGGRTNGKVVKVTWEE